MAMVATSPLYRINSPVFASRGVLLPDFPNPLLSAPGIIAS